MSKKPDSADSKKQKSRLGRGLSSLINTPVAIDADVARSADPGHAAPTAAAPAPDGAALLLRIPLKNITRNPYQPRQSMSREKLEALAASIRAAGVMQPILVRPTHDGKYQLIAGERRWRAAEMAGLTEIPAVVHELNSADCAAWALVENLQREDLDPIERAEAFRALIDRHNLTQSQIAERVGLDRSTVANFVRLNALDDRTRADLRAGRLTIGHAKALLAVEDEKVRRNLAEIAIARRWNVRELEEHVNAGLNTPDTPAESRRSSGGAAKPEHIVRMEREMSEALGLAVELKLNPTRTSGRLIVRFRNLKEFESLKEQIAGE